MNLHLQDILEPDREDKCDGVDEKCSPSNKF